MLLLYLVDFTGCNLSVSHHRLATGRRHFVFFYFNFNGSWLPNCRITAILWSMLGPAATYTVLSFEPLFLSVDRTNVSQRVFTLKEEEEQEEEEEGNNGSR